MRHLTEVELVAAADSALTDAQLLQHVETCELCASRVQQLQAEAGQLREALTTPVEIPPIPQIKFTRSMTFGRFAALNVITGCLIWSLQFLWKMLFEGLIFGALDWLEVPVPDLYGLTVSLALFIYEEGAIMMDQYLGMIITCLIALGIGTAAYLLRNTRSNMTLASVLVLSMLVLAPAPGHAVQTNSTEVFRVGPDERIDDTLFAAGESVLIEGEVTGDVIAFARRVVVKGIIGGNLVTAAQTVQVEGSIGGTTISAADTFSLRDATVGGNVVAAAGNLALESGSDIGGNVILAGEVATVEAEIGHSLTAAAETLEINGAVARDVDAYTAHINLGSEAAIEGDLRIRTNSQDNLHQMDGARVAGGVEFLDLPDEFEQRSRYLSPGFYFFQVLKIIAGLIAGLILLWLAPSLRSVNVRDAIDGAKVGGIGLVALISVPVIAVIIGATLVGLPVALIVFALWMALLYFAKIITAWYLGRLMLGGRNDAGDAQGDSQTNTALILLVGLVTVIVASNLPFVGGIIGFLMSIIGAGLIIQWAWQGVSAREPGAHA